VVWVDCLTRTAWISIRSSADVFNGLMPGGGSRGANPKFGNVFHWSGAGVPQHDAFADFLPDLDGDDPSMGLDIFSTSESGCSLDYMDAVRTTLTPSLSTP
jgi:hypothetical protein